MLLLEGAGDVLQEDQAQNDVLAFSRVHAAPEGIGSLPELGLEAQVGADGLGIRSDSSCACYGYPQERIR
jgi:hypothetical protein